MSAGDARLSDRVARALDAAGERAGEDLLRWLREHHADDPDVVAECESLFRAAADAHPVLDTDLGSVLRAGVERALASSGGGPDGSAGRPEADGAATPERLGRYRVIRLLGEGGMGVVYEAEQDEPRRRVAVKVIRGQARSPGAIARFRSEAQALGQLRHPGVAQIHEASTDPASGTAYFAMEYVEGPTLTEHLRGRSPPAEARVELLARVCDAVQHAHQKGIIHRDLKPSNVLVEAGEDAIGRPKVLDFGVARLTQFDSQSATLAVDAGRIVGTLGYMSPETLEARPELVDTRSDVYSLGVMLHEALTGELPIDVRGLPLTEAARRIREHPPARLSTARPALRGDLTAIVAKALEKDRERRYDSAAELAADLRRYLRHEPVAARPPSALYIAGKLIRRRAGLAAAVATASLAVLGALVAVSIGAVRIAAERDRAERRGYAAAIMAAAAAADAGAAEEARELLRDLPLRPRGWEYRHLSFTINPQLTELASDLGPPTQISVAPGGRFIAGVWQAARVGVVVDSATLREAWRCELPERINGLAVSGDGRWLAVGRDDPEVFMLRQGRSEPVWSKPGVLGPRFLADGRLTLARFGLQSFLRLDPATGAETGPPPPGTPVGDSGLVPVGAELIDAGSGEAVLSQGRPSPITAAAFGPGGAEVLLARLVEGRRSELELRRRGDSVLLRTFQGAAPVGDIAWRSDGERLVTLVGGRPTAHERHGRREPGAFCLPVAGRAFFAPGEPGDPAAPWAGRLITVAAGRSWIAALPGAAAPGPFRFAAPLHERAYESGFSEAADLLATGDWGSVSLWDVPTGALRWRRNLWNDFIRAVAVSPDGRLVAAGAGRGRVVLLDARDGATLATSPDGAGATPTSLEFAVGADRLLAGFDDGGLFVADIPPFASAPTTAAPGALRLREIGRQRGAVERAAITRDGRWALTVAGDGAWQGEMRRAPIAPGDCALRVWSLDAGALAREIPLGGAGLWDIALSPDERHAAVGVEGEPVAIVDWRAGRVVRRLGSGRSRPSVAWSRDGARLAVGGDRLSVALLDVRSGDTMARLDAPHARRLRFAPGDAFLAAHDARSQAVVFETAWPADAVLDERDAVRRAMEILEEAGRDPLLDDVLRPDGPTLGRSARVRATVERTIARAGEHAMRRANIAAILVNILRPGDDAAARTIEAQARAAIAGVPDHPWAHLSLAEAQLRAGRTADAAATLEAARRAVAPAGAAWSATLTLRLAELRARQGDPDQARALLAQAAAAAALEPRADRAANLRAEIERLEQSLPRDAKGATDVGSR